jgi:predicted Zn-dependent peptidase
MKYTRKVLPNGLTILQVPSNDAESVVVNFFVKTGSRSEAPHENGISHFLEHFLFKGSRKFPSSLAITELVDSIGGETNAGTSKENTNYYIKAHHEHLELIFEILTDMIQQPLLDTAELEREKGVIVEEINMYKDMPRDEVGNILERMMWPSDALGQSIAGEKEIVMKFTQEMFIDYMERHYQTPNMIIGISGKFEQKLVDRLIKKYWLPIKKGKCYGWNKVKDVQKDVRFKVKYKDTEQAHLSLGFKGLDFNNKHNPEAIVLAALLGGGMSSRLFYEVRERRGLAYYIHAFSSNYQDTGVFHVDAGITVGEIKQAIETILEQLRKVKTVPIEEKELAKAKAYIQGRTTLALEDNQVRLDWFLEQQAFHHKIEQPKELFAQLDKVTAQDVMKIAQFLFRPEKMNLSIVGPYKDEKMFKKLLKI